MERKDTCTFILQAKALHKEEYDYSLTEYVNSYTKVKIICSEHGIFEQKPNAHLHGNGCPRCSVYKHPKKWSKEEEQFLIENYQLNGIKYCCKVLNKTNNSIFNKASRLKLTIPEINYYEEMPAFIWVCLKKNAKVRKLSVEIKIEDIWIQFVKQNRKCALSGLDIQFAPTRSANTASVDRKDSSLGYTVDNIQIVHKDINRMKMDLSDLEFYQLCKSVYFNLTKESNDNLYS